MKRSVEFSIILIGFSAIASQIVLVRELLIVFYGNELSMAFMFAGWLIGGAIGGVSLGALSDKIKDRVPVFCACQIALSAMLPISIMVIRFVRPILGINPGEIIPIYTIALSSLIILLPICATLGFMFSLASRIYKPESGMGASRIGEVYALEAIGAMVGGAITGFILIRYISSIQTMGVLSFLLSGSAIILFRHIGSSRYKIIARSIATAAFSLYIMLWLFNGWQAIDKYSLDIEWRGSELLASKNSNFGNIVVTKKGGQFSFFDNGLRLYTVPDRPTAEEAAHFALLEHPNPKKVLLIGGGAGGLLGEIARHPVDRIDYVELDPLIIKMAKEYAGGESRSQLSGPKVSIIFEDGRRYIKRTAEKYDVIIINIGDPYTAGLNRFYTLEFFKEAMKVMNQGGVISFGLSASESYIGEELADFLRSIYATLSRVFPDVKVIPGETAYFLASNSKDILTYDYKLLMQRAKSRALELVYVREYYLSSRMSPELITYTENVIRDSGKIRINRDFKPSAYYYGIIAWAKRFKDSSLVTALKSIDEKLILSVIVLVYIAILVIGLGQLARRRLFKDAAILSILVNGFSQMSFQIILLLAFQMIYGYMFYKLGIILAAFMAGIGLGGWLGSKRLLPGNAVKDKYTLIALQCGLCLYPVVLLGALKYLSIWRGEMIGWIGANIIFFLLPFVSGLLGGYIFPTVSALSLNAEGDRGRTAGLNYGIDLFGSCAGAVLTGVFLIPVLGIPDTCLAISALNFKVLLVLIAGAIFI